MHKLPRSQSPLKNICDSFFSLRYFLVLFFHGRLVSAEACRCSKFVRNSFSKQKFVSQFLAIARKCSHFRRVFATIMIMIIITIINTFVIWHVATDTSGVRLVLNFEL